MIKNILICTLIGLSFATNAQTISEIKNSSESVKGRMSNSFYKHDIPQFKKLRSMLKLDVFEYYDLKKQYDSELKQKVFKSSDDYKAKLSKLTKSKAELKSTTYYLDFQPTYYERNNLIKYNLATKTFKVSNEIYADDFYNKTGFIQFDQIVFKSPIGISNKRRSFDSGGVAFIDQDIAFKISEEALALKIEENRSNLKLLFVFKFTEASPFQGLDFFGRKMTKYVLMSKVEKVIVYNSSTNEIYHTFQ